MSFSHEVERRAAAAQSSRSVAADRAATTEAQGDRELREIRQEAQDAVTLLTRANIRSMPLVLDAPRPTGRRVRRPPKFVRAGTAWWLGEDVALTDVGAVISARQFEAKFRGGTERMPGDNSNTLAELRKVGVTSGPYLKADAVPQLPELRFHAPHQHPSEPSGAVVWIQLPLQRDESINEMPLRSFLVDRVAQLVAAER